MADTAILSRSFRISIPKSIRDTRNWQVGQRFVFLPKGASVLIVPVPEAKELAGIVKGARVGRYRDRKDRY